VTLQPRLMTGAESAAYLGLTPASFTKWVADGRAPKPLPGTRRWDRKAIDLALDKVSGIPSAPISKEDQGAEELEQWCRDYESRNAARELDPEYIQKKAAREAALAKRRGRQKPPV
jgi:predicted DNA-binding transcriptional regulator AlpA